MTEDGHLNCSPQLRSTLSMLIGPLRPIWSDYDQLTVLVPDQRQRLSADCVPVDDVQRPYVSRTA
jgi:hypothetical protein